MIAALYCLSVALILSYLLLLQTLKRHEVERRDLLNRIMARDYNEYTYAQKPASQPAQPKNSYKEAVRRSVNREAELDEG